jgi:hypothetical protein
MKPVGDLIAELEMAIRGEYDSMIATLTRERDEKIAQIRALAPGRNGSPAAAPHPKAPVAEAPATSRLARTDGRAPTQIERASRAAAAMRGDFKPADLLPFLKGIDPIAVPPLLRRLLELGEVELVTKGTPMNPPVYRSKTKAPAVPPSVAAGSQKLPHGSAATSSAEARSSV